MTAPIPDLCQWLEEKALLSSWGMEQQKCRDIIAALREQQAKIEHLWQDIERRAQEVTAAEARIAELSRKVSEAFVMLNSCALCSQSEFRGPWNDKRKAWLADAALAAGEPKP